VPKEAVFTMKLESDLRDDFIAEADAAHRPASQVVRELMREFVQRQRDARDYDPFLRGEVEVSRASMRAGRGLLVTRSRPALPPGASRLPARREGRLDARSASRSPRHLGLHRRWESEFGRADGPTLRRHRQEPERISTARQNGEDFWNPRRRPWRQIAHSSARWTGWRTPMSAPC